MDRNYENALIQVCNAIDGTAKKKMPYEKEPGKRIKKFVKEYEAFIYQFASAGGLVLKGSCNKTGRISYPGDDLPEILYRSIRCVLLHGDELSDFVMILAETGIIGISKAKIVLNKGFIGGFLFSVVSDEVNKGEFCDSLPTYSFSGSVIKINEVWGNMQRIEILQDIKRSSNKANSAARLFALTDLQRPEYHRKNGT